MVLLNRCRTYASLTAVGRQGERKNPRRRARRCRLPRIFISYRREDDPSAAGRLYDSLAGHFGAEHVFMDVDTIEPGVNFYDLIEESLSEVEALIAVIGRGWLTTVDAQGRRRLDDDHDWVRLEIAQALERDIRVVPVLVNGATMPGAADLPADLTGLGARNALELKATDWRAGVERLVASLERLIGPVASEPALSHRPATEAVGPVASEPALSDRKAAEAPTILLEQLNPGERLEDWFYADLDAFRDSNWVIGITATRLISMTADRASRTNFKPISIDFAHVTSVIETSSMDALGPGGLRLDLKSGGWHEFIPRGNMKKLLSELKSRVKVASS